MILKHSGQFKAGQKPWNLGNKASAETKCKMSEAKLGKKYKLGKKTGPHSEEHKAKIAKSNTGNKRSKETCDNIKAAKAFISKGTRLKMSEAKKGAKSHFCKVAI